MTVTKVIRRDGTITKFKIRKLVSAIEKNMQAVSIEDDELLGGNLPKAKMKLVQAWIEIHREDLLANWRLAVAGEPVFRIDPLK